MAGETPFGSLGGQPIQSCRSTIIQFQKNQIDYSSIYRLANSYTCRIGHEFGTGWVLMLAKDLADIDSALPQDLIIGIGDKSVTIKKLAVVGSQRLFPAESQDPDGLHLVQLADVRWFLRRTTINKRYNLRKYCTSTGWIDGTLKNCCTSYQPWTFAEICEDIWGEFSSFGTFFNDFSTWSTETDPAIQQAGNIYGGDPTVIPENIRFEGVSALDALTSLCQQYGYFLRYDPTIGDLVILKVGYTPDPNPGADGWMEDGFGGADTIVRDNRTGQLTSFPATPKNTPRTSSDGLTEDTETFIGVPYIPASVTVVFQNNGDGCSEIANVDSSSGRGWFYEVEKTAENIRSVALTDSYFSYMDTVAEDTSVTLYSTVSARFTSSTATVPINTTALNEEAKRIATDYYRTIGVHANSRVVFDGIKEIVPGPNVCEVTWREWGDGLKTELAKMPIPVGLSKTQKLFSEGNVPAATTTTISPGTTTSTTTTIDPALRVCDGQCKWVWDASTGTWSTSSSECSTTTTTSTTANPSSTTCNPNPKCTTSTSTTTSTTSTTTTTSDPSSSTSSTSSTTSTSTTTAAPCKCMAPAFCGTDDGECWYGSCSQLYSTPISCPPSTTTGTSTSTTTQTTTTCDCSATTTTAEPTTTLDPSCTGCDTFFVGIRTIRVISGCDEDLCGRCVEAENPQILGGPDITCSFVHTPCTGRSGPGGVTTTQQGQQNSIYCGPPFPFTACGFLCVGSIAAGVPYAWEYGGGNCYAYGCGCAPPARPCSVCGDSGLVPCGGNGPPLATTTASGGGGGDACYQQCHPTTTLTTTTTTTTATPCSACKFRWNGSSWGSAIVNNCSPCSCLTPAYSGADSCEVTWSGCGESTTTSSTTATTSTSTTSTTSTTTTTTTSTTTSTTTTSTTTTSTTTTTACPAVGTCNCQYQCNGTIWVYVNDACGLYGNCDAQNPGACTENGACTEVYCPGCPTTTTSTTTTAAPTTTTTTSVTAAPTTTTTTTTSTTTSTTSVTAAPTTTTTTTTSTTTSTTSVTAAPTTTTTTTTSTTTSTTSVTAAPTTTTTTTTSTTTTATSTTTTSTTTTTCAPCADSNCIYVCSGGYWALTGGSCIPLACRPLGCNCVDATFIPCSPDASIIDVACGVSPTTTAAP